MPTNRNLIGREWEEFRLLVVSPAAGPDQLREMRLAFYSGAMAALSVFRLRAEDDVRAAGLGLLDELDAELRAFKGPAIAELERARRLMPPGK